MTTVDYLQGILVKFGRVIFELRYATEQTDRQTVDHGREPYETGYTDRDAVWNVDSH